MLSIGLDVMVAVLTGDRLKAWWGIGQKKRRKSFLLLIKTCRGLLSCHSVIVNITFVELNWKLKVQIDLFL